MGYDVVWSFSAERDRGRIVEYLLYDLAPPQAAKHVLDALDAMIDVRSDKLALDGFTTRHPPPAKISLPFSCIYTTCWYNVICYESPHDSLGAAVVLLVRIDSGDALEEFGERHAEPVRDLCKVL